MDKGIEVDGRLTESPDRMQRSRFVAGCRDGDISIEPLLSEASVKELPHPLRPAEKTLDQQPVN